MPQTDQIVVTISTIHAVVVHHTTLTNGLWFVVKKITADTKSSISANIPNIHAPVKKPRSTEIKYQQYPSNATAVKLSVKHMTGKVSLLT